jgi:sugar (pentulose or hexulose) kinase
MLLPTVTVDIGTTSVKLCVFDADGEPMATARHATPTTRDAWGEIYDLDALKRVVVGFVNGLDSHVRGSVRRVTIAGVGESGGLVRSDISLASPMILWHDHRGADFLSSLGEAERALIYRVTGLPANANYGLSKVAWSLAHAGDAGADAQWLNVAEYLAAWMTGRRWSERSLASRTMALDVASGTWSAEVCALLGVDVGVFPELRSAVHGTPIAPGFARQAALDPGVMVHVAGHDHMVGAVGADLRSGELLNSTGTTEGILLLRESPSLDGHSEQAKLANGLACEGSKFTLFASIPTGGSAFATLQTMLGLSPERLSGCLDDLHTRYLANDINLDRMPLVLPQFRGSPPPTKQASARGIIAGLGSDTSAEDIVFGCFLGMALQFSDVLDLFRTPVTTIKVIGPASVNKLWLQLKADLLHTPLSVSNFPEVVSRGAQALASQTSLGWDTCHPREVVVNDARAAMLTQWRADNRSRWEYLKGVPS